MARKRRTSGDRARFERSKSVGTLQRAKRADPVPGGDAADDRARDRQWDGAHQVEDPVCEVIVSAAHVLDVQAPGVLAARSFQLLRERAVLLHGLRQRVDRARVDKNERGRHGRVSGGELDADHSAEAVADDDRPMDRDLCTEPRQVVGEVGDRVTRFRGVAQTATA